MEEAPEVTAFLEWAADRIPVAMHPGVAGACLAAIEYEGVVFGAERAVTEPYQIVQGVRVRGELVGQVYVACTTEHRFLDEESALLGEITRRVSAYIERQRLLRAAQASSDESAVLYELGRSLASRLEMREVLDLIYRGVSRLMDVTNFDIGLYEPERQEVAFPLNVTESVVDKRITVVSADEGLIGHVIRSGESLLVRENVAGWMERRGIPVVGEPSQSWLGVPLLVGDEVLGVMVVRNYSTPRAFSETDQVRLEAIAGQASVAVQTARLFEQLQTRARHEQVLREITARVRGSSDPDAILRAAVRELGTALGRRAFVRLSSAEELASAMGDPVWRDEGFYPETVEGGE
jgi:GAF domain-containing protein